jgi:hypothetical protein
VVGKPGLFMSKLSAAKTIENALAILISSTHSKKRTKSLMEIAEWLAYAVEELGSIKAVGERIDLSPQMLRQFESVQKLDPKVQWLFSTRRVDSVDAAAHLSMLRAKEQIAVASLLAEGKIDTGDVRAIYHQRKAGDTDPIEALIDKVEKSKTKQEYVVEFAIRGSQNPERVKAAIGMVFPKDQVVELELHGPMGRLILTKKGRATLSATAKKLNIPLKSVMASVLQK